MNRAERVAWPALTLVVAVLAAIALVAVIGGGAGALAVARVIVRLVLDLGAGIVLGVLVALMVVLPAPDARRGRLLDVAAGAAAVWTVAAGVTVFLRYLDVAPAFSAPGFGPGFVAYLGDPDLGRTWLAAAIDAAVLTTALVAVRSRTGVALLTAAAVLALVPVALQAGAAADPVAVERAVFSAGLVRLVGTAACIGLLCLAAMLPLTPPQLRRTAGAAAVGGGTATAAVLLGAGAQASGGVPLAAVAVTAVVLALGTVVALVARTRPSRGSLRACLLVLGAAAGPSAVVAAGGRLEVHRAARTAPAAILTGSPLPPPLSPARLLGSIQPDALWLIVCAALLIGYLAAVLLLRRRGSGWAAGRVTCWVAGVVVVGWLTSGGPAVYREVLLSAHLVQHAALLLPVPLLLALGAPLRLRAALRGGADGERAGRGVPGGPVPAAVIAVGAFAALYGTGLLPWSLTDPAGAEASVLLPLAAGCVLVAALRAPRVRRRTAVLTAAGLLVVEVAGTAAFASGSGLLLAGWFGAMGWGTDALIDQRTGALIAGAVLVVPTAVLLLIALRRMPGEDVLPGRRTGTVRRPQKGVPA